MTVPKIMQILEVTRVGRFNTGWWVLLAGMALQSAAFAQAEPSGLAAYEGLLTKGFVVLLFGLIGLVAWEVADNRKASRSSLDIAKLAAAAAKKQSAAGAPSGSLAQLEPPPSSRPFAPPPPPPPPKQPPASEPSMETSSPFAAPAREEAANPFAAPPSEMISSPGSLESTVAFSPSGGDPGSSGGWADLLQRVRAGEPEAASFGQSSPPPSTEDEGSGQFVVPGGLGEAMGGPSQAPMSPASSSEAWEALLKRTTSSESGPGPAKVTGGGDKISLNSTFQLPGEASAPPPAPSGFGMSASPFGGGGSEQPPVSNIFGGGGFDDGGATFPSAGGGSPFSSGADPSPFGTISEPSPFGTISEPSPFSMSSEPSPFSMPSSPPPPEPAGAGLGGFSFGSSEPAEPSPFSMAPPGGFEPPTFKLPGSPSPVDDFGGGGSGGFQIPSGAGAMGGGGGFGAANPFDFGGGMGAANENPSSSTLPLSDLFSSKSNAGGPPAFQLPTGGGGTPDFMGGGGGLDIDSGNPGLGRTISLDFAKGGGQKPPPPLPKTEG